MSKIFNVIVDMMDARYIFVMSIINSYNKKYIRHPSETNLSTLAEGVIEKLSTNLLDNTKKATFSHITLDSSNVNRYREFLQSVIDKLIYDCAFLDVPINLDINEAHNLIVETENTIIDKICSVIPNIDESNISIIDYKAMRGFGLFIVLRASLNAEKNNSIFT